MLFVLSRNTKSTASETLLQRLLWGVVPLSLVVAGIWMTNGPLGIMASYLLAATALVSAAIRKSWEPLVRAVLSFAIGGALAAVYLVPAIWQRNWASIGSAIREREYVSGEWMAL